MIIVCIVPQWQQSWELYWSDSLSRVIYYQYLTSHVILTPFILMIDIKLFVHTIQYDLVCEASVAFTVQLTMFTQAEGWLMEQRWQSGKTICCRPPQRRLNVVTPSHFYQAFSCSNKESPILFSYFVIIVVVQNMKITWHIPGSVLFIIFAHISGMLYNYSAIESILTKINYSDSQTTYAAELSSVQL